MGAITAVPGTRTLLTNSALNSLASANFVSAGTIDVSAAKPLDVVIEVEATPGTVSSLKQLAVYLRYSFDGSVFSTGPVSGTSVVDEPNLAFLGVLPLNTNATLQRIGLSVMAALGFVPPHLQVVIKNETGAALAASGHAVNYTTYTGNAA